MGKSMKWALLAAAAVALAGLSVWAAARPTVIRGGAASLSWADCQPEQVEVLILGTFHFAQQGELDVLGPGFQEQVSRLVDGLERFGPDKVAVEHPFAENEELNSRYGRYLRREDETPEWTNETAQVGFRLARRLGHDRVYAVDVPMNLWHDSIRVFDERYPDARERLRRRWDVRHANRDLGDGASLAAVLTAGNRDLPPANSEMYANFLPLVEGEVYAGALKLRPWYDRNLRIVQNFFRILEEDDERLFMVVGWGHLRVLKQILEMTPQLCAVDPVPYLSAVDRD